MSIRRQHGSGIKRRESGSAGTEYALLIAAIVSIFAGAVWSLRDFLNESWQHIADLFDNLPF